MGMACDMCMSWVLGEPTSNLPRPVADTGEESEDPEEMARYLGSMAWLVVVVVVLGHMDRMKT